MDKPLFILNLLRYLFEFYEKDLIEEKLNRALLYK
jgi:hypothetical protein